MWYVRFWDENAQKFSKTRSTGVLVVGKRQRRPEADAVARDLLASINFTPKPKGPLFLDYVEAFWTPESSYVREKALVAKKPLTNAYVKMSRESLILHARPFARFQGLLLTDLNAGHIRDWVQWKAEAGLGPRWINATLQTMRVAVRQAFQREELPKDPFEFVRPATDWPKAKGILNQTEACGLGEVRLNDRREPLAVMLAALCGLGAVKSRTCPGATSAVPQTLSMSSTTM